MKLLIFQSETTQAVYCFNGTDIVTIVEAEGRPIGAVMKGIDKEFLNETFEQFDRIFYVREAKYKIIEWIDTESKKIKTQHNENN